jgi:hypothetical protein
LKRLLLAPKLGHPVPQLLQLHQSFLIGVEKFVDLKFGALETLFQVCSPFLQRVGFEAFLTTTVKLRPNQLGLFQQIDDLAPDQFV